MPAVDARNDVDKSKRQEKTIDASVVKGGVRNGQGGCSGKEYMGKNPNDDETPKISTQVNGKPASCIGATKTDKATATSTILEGSVAAQKVVAPDPVLVRKPAEADKESACIQGGVSSYSSEASSSNSSSEVEGDLIAKGKEGQKAS